VILSSTKNQKVKRTFKNFGKMRRANQKSQNENLKRRKPNRESERALDSKTDLVQESKALNVTYS
jgi:hypothetical protein